jgi:hypothetical protein
MVDSVLGGWFYVIKTGPGGGGGSLPSRLSFLTISIREYILFGHGLKASLIAYQSIKDKSAYCKL